MDLQNYVYALFQRITINLKYVKGLYFLLFFIRVIFGKRRTYDLNEG